MSRRGWILFIALGIIWGVPYLFLKIAVGGLSPAAVVFSRCALAVVVLLPLAASRGALRTALPHWRWILVFSGAEIAIPFLMLAVAEQRLSSSLTGLLIAAVPLIGAVLARLLHLDDRLDRGRLIGLLVGLAGVATLVGIDVRGGDLLSVAAVGIAAIGYAIGPILVATRLSGVPALGVTTLALTLNALVYAPFAIATWPQDTAAVETKVWVSVAVLGLLCSAVAFMVFFALVAEVGPARTTVITYVNPAVAVVLGVLVLSEPVTAGLLVGFPLVLLGSWLATRKGPAVEAEPHC